MIEHGQFRLRLIVRQIVRVRLRRVHKAECWDLVNVITFKYHLHNSTV